MRTKKSPNLVLSVAAALAFTVSLSNTLLAGGGQPTLIGWNNLGMHCMDDDYSVFTILPPYNTIDAHYLDATGNLVTSDDGVTVTYEAMADPDGSINSTVIGKSNFWDYVLAAYGAAVPLEWGLAGTRMPGPSNIPQPMTWDATFQWFEGLGVPITPIDDAGHSNPYPMFRLVARDGVGTELAHTDIVLPVSSEMDCRACHASGSGLAARPAAGWVEDPNDKRDFRLNILRLHDESHLDNLDYLDALAANGWPASGLYDAVTVNNTPILCAKCHLSEALPDTGIDGIPQLTTAIHGKHALVIDPDTLLTLDSIDNRGACYTCHPGSATRCLRGAMGASVALDGTMQMQCQSCHGSMSKVGDPLRTGWFDEPTCQQCHTGSATLNNGEIRYTSAFDGDTPRVAVNTLFATNPDTPVPGVSLYRFSKGHGDLQCSACHGSTHAEYPTSHRNDNLQSAGVQGHVGVIADCTACHATMPNTVTGGPHGMHPVGSAWVARHKDYGESSGCSDCHGTDHLGTVLSRAFADRTMVVNDDNATKTVHLWRGETISCFICHAQEDDLRLGGVFTNHVPPVVGNVVLLTPEDTPGGLTLTSVGPSNSFRIVQQPQHGAVALTNAAATYFPEPGYAGPDSFTFAAIDDLTESNLGVVSVKVGEVLESRDTDLDGLTDIFEYALGLSPDFPTVYSTPALEEISGQRYLVMKLPQGLVPRDAFVVVEVSADLSTWSPATVVAGAPYELRALDPISVESGLHRFIRARVVQQ